MAEFKKVTQKALVKSADMPADMANEVVEIITGAVEKHLTTENFEKAAQMIKESMDKKYGSTWHCCIGEGFGFEVTYEARHLLLLQHAERVAVLVFKS